MIRGRMPLLRPAKSLPQIIIRAIQPVITPGSPHIHLFNIAYGQGLMWQIRRDDDHVTGAKLHDFRAIVAESEAHAP